MKATKKQIAEFIKQQLATNDAWTLRALVRIYEHQTVSEKMIGATQDDNGIGFSGCDAEILSSFAVQYQRKGSLSPKQMTLLRKKIVRYHKQIANLIPHEKLVELITNQEVATVS